MSEILLAFFIVLSLYLWIQGALMPQGFRDTHPDIFGDKPPLKLWQVILWPFMWLIPVKEKEDE